MGLSCPSPRNPSACPGFSGQVAPRCSVTGAWSWPFGHLFMPSYLRAEPGPRPAPYWAHGGAPRHWGSGRGWDGLGLPASTTETRPGRVSTAPEGPGCGGERVSRGASCPQLPGKWCSCPQSTSQPSMSSSPRLPTRSGHPVQPQLLPYSPPQVAFTDIGLTARDNEGATVLHFAARGGHSPVLDRLLLMGAPIMRDSWGGTALHDAAENGQMEVRRRQAPVCLVISEGTGNSKRCAHHTLTRTPPCPGGCTDRHRTQTGG